MLNSISAIVYQTKSTLYKPYPSFSIDREPLDSWFSQRLSKIDIHGEGHFIGVDIENLVPAQGWLIDDDEMQTAWHRITPSDVGLTTIVPLLICDSDVDFSCIVLVVEQEVSDEFIDWCRVGFSMDCEQDRVGGTVKWLDTPCKARFQKTEFINALDQFKKLCDTEWV
jgi:hypothetical protein